MFRRTSSEPETPATTTGKVGGKGRPTPTRKEAEAAARAYDVLGAASVRPKILVAAGYGPLEDVAWRTLAAAPIDAIAIDLHRGAVPAAVPGLETEHALEMVISRLRRILPAPLVATVIKRGYRLDP